MADGNSRIKVICPLRFEYSRLVRVLGRLDIDLECIGPGMAGVEGWFERRRSDHSDDAQPRLVVLTGLAGGLAPIALPGRAFVCRRVVTTSGELIGECNIQAELDSDERLTVTSTEELVHTPQERADLFRRSGAHLVDQESVTFVQRAIACGIPWLIVRGVSDGVNDTLPIGIEDWVDQRGRTRVARVAVSMMRRPTSIVAANRLGRRSASAMSDVARLIQQEAASLDEE